MNMTRISKLVLAAVGTIAMTSVYAAEGNKIKGESYYAVCAGCHGADAMGMEATNAPRLQGQFDWYLIRQIKNYQAGIRGVHKDDVYGATMRGMASTLPNEQAINDVVAYIASLESN